MNYISDTSWVKYEQYGNLAQAATVLFNELRFNYYRMVEHGFSSVEKQELVNRIYYGIIHKQSFITAYPNKLPSLLSQIKNARKKMKKLMRTI